MRYMKNRFIVLLIASLALLVTAVFVLAGILEHRRYHASLQVVEADCLQLIRAESQNIRQRLRAAERERFSLFDRSDLTAVESVSNRLFSFDGKAFSPYMLPYGEGNSVSAAGLEALRLARDISSLATNKAPFRSAFRDSVLSVDGDGRACLMPVELFRGEAEDTPVQVDTRPPAEGASLIRELNYPPVVAWIPDHVFAQRRRPVERAYIMTNFMLVTMFLLLTGLGAGIRYLTKRGHEMARLRSAFVSAVSHELRTPMALIRLYAESMATDTPVPGTRERYSKAIVAETDRLLALVNNVLDFSRIEKGMLKVNPVTIDISEICTEVLDLFALRLERENIRLERRIEPHLNALADPVAIGQVMFNIVDNAVTYSEAGSTVTVELARNDSHIRILVKDNGPGIADELKPRVFDAFVRGTGSRVTSKRGSGLGLHVAAQLLERMNGRISITDNQPSGTVAEITLPSVGSGAEEKVQA